MTMAELRSGDYAEIIGYAGYHLSLRRDEVGVIKVRKLEKGEIR